MSGSVPVPGGWTVKRVRNPWGRVPHTGGGRSLTHRAQQLVDRITERARSQDAESVRRHHYVPRAYLRRWSFDSRRVWTLDTKTGSVRPIGVGDLCVEENFHRVLGRNGESHNAVEMMFGAVDQELCRMQKLFDGLQDAETLTLDDLQILCVSIASQRMRTVQQRRLQSQSAAWMAAQDPDFKPWVGDAAPHFAAGVHTKTLFRALWEATDVFVGRQIEVWEDDAERFMTCDAPVLVPFLKGGNRPPLLEADRIIWPVSPRRVVVLSRELVGERAIIRSANGKDVGIVRDAVLQGRERMIIAGELQSSRLARLKRFNGRRAQVQMRCSDRSPNGEYVPPPGCVVRTSDAFAAKPDVVLCAQGFHRPAPDMYDLT